MKPILLDLPMPITTPRLLIRPPQIGDGSMLNAAVIESFDTLKLYMPWANERPSLEDSEEVVRREAAHWILKPKTDPELMLLILERNSHNLIGATGYHNIDWDIPSVETGYWIRNKYAGCGLMTEAVNAITQYAFKVLNAKRIAITCDIDNIKSKKIPERLGYSLEATLKFHRIKPLTNEVSDTLLYARYNLADLPDLKVTW
ncbi:TPA: GNAT family N-acetyltransferase [Legionella pneumophila]|nr:GNAT family N-acetyltransferase [Legionella pneumophila]HAU0297538.1 GNAT family N-acetyltransferase [Legionella pneumophila]